MGKGKGPWFTHKGTMTLIVGLKLKYEMLKTLLLKVL